jgi:hypothetical protein
MVFEIITATNINVTNFWDVNPCSMMDKNQYFERTAAYEFNTGYSVV